MTGYSKKEAKCPVCGHEQSCNWEVPMFDPPKCNKCGNYMKRKYYGSGLMFPKFI